MIESVVGAGGTVGSGRVKRAPANGYTLLFCGSGALTIAPKLQEGEVATLEDFVPLMNLATIPYIIAVRKDSTLRSARDFIAFVRQNPGKLSYGTPGVGSAPHLGMEAFAARFNSSVTHVPFSGIATAREALAAIEADGDIQAVIVDDKLYTLPEGKKGAEGGRAGKQLQMSALELVRQVTGFRPELDVYILIAKESEDEVVDALFTEAVDGYFYREERDYRGIYRILNAQIQEKARTPFADALKSYVWMAKDQWHTPGHSSGESLRGSPWVNDFYEFMGEHVFDADLSVSVPMLDSLMEPKGVILEAQAMAAKAFGARRKIGRAHV